MVATIEKPKMKPRGGIVLAISQRFINYLADNGKAELVESLKSEYDEYKRVSNSSDYWAGKSAVDLAAAIAKHEAIIAKARAALAGR